MKLLWGTNLLFEPRVTKVKEKSAQKSHSAKNSRVSNTSLYLDNNPTVGKNAKKEFGD
jgi:hypothetical protein